MRRDAGSRWSSVAVLVLLILPGGFMVSYAPTAGGSPSVNDLGTGNKTVSWNFTDPADYVLENVSAAGGIRLNTTNAFLAHDSDIDFGANGTWDAANLTIAGGSIGTVEHRREIVVNGTLDSEAPWRFANSTDGNVTAGWDGLNGTASYSHTRSAAPFVSFDEMDSGAGLTWFDERGGGAPMHILNSFVQDYIVYHEPPASACLNVDFKSQLNDYVGLYTNILPAQDWLLYNRLGVWLNTDYGGAETLDAYLSLTSNPGPFSWDLPRLHMTTGWGFYLFDLTSFPGNLGSIIRLDIRFTNVTGTNAVNIWTDDIWLYHYDAISQSASVSQDVQKVDFTDPALDSVLLSFDYNVSSSVNLAGADLTARVNDTLWSSPPIPANATVDWTRAGPFNLSSSLTGKGSFNLSFVVSLSFSTAFATSLVVSIDNISLTLPDHDNGTYESFPLDLKNAFILDNVSFAASSHPDTNVTLEVRGGWSNQTDDGSWTPWERHSGTPEVLLNGSAASFLQYRVTLNTTNESAAASFDSVVFDFHRHVDDGSVRTQCWSPPETLIGWRRFAANYTAPPSTSVEFYVSDDNGSTWLSVLPDDPLDMPIGNNISLMAEIETLNATFTPELFELNVTYEFLGPLFKITVSPATWSGTADDQFTFTAKANDQWGHLITPFAPNWTDDDPAGSVDAVGQYQAGREGGWHVCASLLGVIDCANVTVAHGRLVSIQISPTTAIVTAKTTRLFSASGFDAVGNDVPLTDTSWTTDVGNFSDPIPASALFLAFGVPAIGHVWAVHDSLSGTLVSAADVTVTASTAVFIQGLVPNQRYPEDSPPWQLDMTPYLPVGLNHDDLMWHLKDRDDSLYTVLGEWSFGQHVLTFYPRDDAFGDDDVTLWLEDRLGARDSQPLQVSLTPVNDPPVFYDVDRMQVRAGGSYVMDYSPYIFDIDTAKNMLILSTDDPTNTRVSGLSVNYTYSADYAGQTVMVRLRISDGSASSSTIQLIDVVGGGNACPHSVKPLPSVSMLEDVPDADAFPDILQNYFGDADGDQLAYSLGSMQHMTAAQWTSPPNYIHVNISSDLNWFGVEYLRVRATDPSGCFAEQNAKVTVVAVNDPPVLNWHDDVYVKRNVTYDLDLTDFVSDVDNEVSDLTLTVNDSLLATVEEFVVRILASYMVGPGTSFPLTLTLDDGLATDWSNITVHVGDNAPPALNPAMSLPAVIFYEDTVSARAFCLENYFLDPDGPQPLNYTFTSENVIVQIDSRDDYVNFSARQNWSGQEVVHVRASDGEGFITGRLTIRVLPVNDAPVIDDMPDWDLGTGGLVAIDLRDYVHDVDNDITELRFSTNSAKATVIGYILVLDYRNNGVSETVTLTANDTQGQAQTSFDITISGITPEDGGEMPLWAQIVWPFSIIMLVIIGAFGAVAYNRVLDRRYTLEDAFLVGKGERLIIHTTRHARADRDEDTIARMFTSIQSFIRESFKQEGDMRSYQFNDWEILVEKGRDFFVAAVFAGEAPETAADSMRNFAGDVDAHFAPVLSVWSGDADELRGLRSFMDAFVAHRKYSKGDWKKADKKRKGV